MDTGRGSNNESRKNVPRLGTYVPNLGTIQSLSPLADALFGTTRGLVLALLFGHPDQEFYTREIIEALDMGQGAVQRELKRLADAGILLRERRGREVYYRANPSCPIHKELVGLVHKTLGLADVLHSALSHLAEKIQLAFVYGSMAKRTSGARSDVDVMVVGSASFSEIVAALSPTQDVLGREVNPSVYASEEFQNRLARADHFLTTVLGEPKIFLIGGQDDLERLVGQRLGDKAPDQPARDR